MPTLPVDQNRSKAQRSTPSALEREVEKVLGIGLPDGAHIENTEDGGIESLHTDLDGTIRITTISKDGNWDFSITCGEDTYGKIMHEKTFAGVKSVPACTSFYKIRQGSVSPEKLKAARNLIMKNKI